jgi:hypothetical protein
LKSLKKQYDAGSTEEEDGDVYDVNGILDLCKFTFAFPSVGRRSVLRFETPSTYDAALTNDFAMSAFPASNNLPASAAAWDGALATTAALPPVENENYSPTSIFSYSSTHAPFFPTAMQFAANIHLSESSRTGYSHPQQPVNILTRQNTQDVAYYRNKVIGPGPKGPAYGSENHYDCYNLAFDISSMDSLVGAPFLPYSTPI